jgi:hypothetical protein
MPNAASTELRNAGSRPFHDVERHIWNHSPPMAMNPPMNSTRIIARPMVPNRLARSKLRVRLARSQAHSEHSSTMAAADSQMMTPM